MFQMQAFPVCHSELRIPTAVTQVDAEAWFQSLAWRSALKDPVLLQLLQLCHSSQLWLGFSP